ncbi:hydroxylamine reductase [Striga asiatica]|uniref:Hydroxylamine reductase n=1 Tax=Striga asiatica TaxID=4170 RepID=A0A5A7REF1_STRAF|nr:hydroxylamine reductase [Striga asiatica]
MTVVLFTIILSNASCTTLSDSASSALVASSKSKILGRHSNFFITGTFLPISNIILNAGCEKYRFLADKTDFRPNPLELKLFEIGPIDEHFTCLWIIESLNQTYDSRFPAPTLPHQSGRRATWDEQRKASEYLLIWSSWVAEVYVS